MFATAGAPRSGTVTPTVDGFAVRNSDSCSRVGSSTCALLIAPPPLLRKRPSLAMSSRVKNKPWLPKGSPDALLSVRSVDRLPWLMFSGLKTESRIELKMSAPPPCCCCKYPFMAWVRMKVAWLWYTHAVPGTALWGNGVNAAAIFVL